MCQSCHFRYDDVRGRPAGWQHRDESRQKMSEDRRGKPKTPEHRAAIGAALTGHRLSDETRAKISAARKKQVKT